MKRFRGLIQEAGFEIRPGDHPIIPIMLGEAKLAREMADMLLRYLCDRFQLSRCSKGQARIRIQISADHSKVELARAAMAFTKVAEQLKILAS